MIDDDNVTFRIDRSRIQFEHFEDETVLINVENGFYYSLSHSGSELLQLVDGGCPVGLLARALLGDSEDAARLSAELIRFVEDLVTEGILTPNHASVSAKHTFDLSNPVHASTGAFEMPVLDKFDEVSDLLLIDPVHMVDQTQGWPKT